MSKMINQNDLCPYNNNYNNYSLFTEGNSFSQRLFYHLQEAVPYHTTNIYNIIIQSETELKHRIKHYKHTALR